MESVYFDLDCGKDVFFPDCTQDPLVVGDVTDTFWPFLANLPPSESSSPDQDEPAASKNATSCTESQDESIQVWNRSPRAEPGSSAVPDVSSSEASHLAAEPSARHTRKRGTAELCSSRLKARTKHSRHASSEDPRLETLLQACQELQSRNRLLEHVAQVACSVGARLSSTQGLREQLFEMQLSDCMVPYAAALAWPELVSPPIVRVLTMDVFISGVFPNYLERLRKLLEGGGWDAATPDGQLLVHLVQQRRKAEDSMALFSEWPAALLAWNQEEAATLSKPPSDALHTSLLEGLRLSQGQAEELVAARRRLLAALLTVQARRKEAIMAMGLALLQHPPAQDQAAGLRTASVPLADIQRTLDEERSAVATFLHACIDQVLTPAQSSWLDCQCHPWTPHLWTLAGLLAERNPAEPSRAAEAQLLAAGATAPAANAACEADKAREVALNMGAFGLLRAPLLGRGAGLALRRMVVLQPLPGMGQAPTHSTGTRTLSALRYARLLDVLAGRTTPKAPTHPRNSPERIVLDQCLQRLAPPPRPPPYKPATAV
ncbi:hypothetical protein WJX73_002007 [Symbiochloris irregularis]|uniref:Uncharacterized protein n=1 Tax=Symbiochloris irregularis TaxID=706552 RepID=A0AAW1NZ30_9CHLO